MKTKKILVESSIGDLIDRITILEIKKLKISNRADLNFVNKELFILKNILRIISFLIPLRSKIKLLRFSKELMLNQSQV